MSGPQQPSQKGRSFEDSMGRAMEGWTVRHYASVGSTMDVARESIAEAKLALPCVVVADQQTAGRGRQGRGWLSEKGALAFTAVLAAPPSSAALSGLSLACGVIVAEALNTFGIELRLKWPNDLFTSQGQKLGGILIEVLSKPRPAVLVGIGMNVVAAPDVPGSAALNPSYGVSVTAAQCLTEILPKLRTGYEEFLTVGFAGFRERWMARAMFINSSLHVEVGEGVIDGICRGVTTDGALLLETAQGSREVRSGHVLRWGD